ncbi:unnamed protein product [Clonostachys rosea]|uniref:Zn(2)-C6 fungal-type domain-containing protein n=1 Tax=Bionectria ochroleuca TaxID=29856 RepID=A0ABY6TQM7_BIOOC|nr:unnamed protein product [Clonostachys rosea]
MALKIRKRSPVACGSCRERKVRCDVAQKGAPCTNCHLDQLACFVATKRRRKNFAAFEVKKLPITSVAEINKNLIRSILPTKPPSLSASSAASSPRASPNCKDSPESLLYTQYSFLSLGNLDNIPAQEVHLLQNAGCFRIPKPEDLCCFLKQYFLYVHPFCPMLHEGALWELFTGADGNELYREGFSLMLLQAMMFASSSFVDGDVISSFGFGNTSAARATLYQRAKLLFNLEAETSPLYRSQTALLLSFWSLQAHSQPQESSVPWLSIAIAHAKEIVAPRYDSSLDPQIYKSRPRETLLKRLWWACIIRDRMIPQGFQRALNISQADPDFQSVTPLTHLDFTDEIMTSQACSSKHKLLLVGLVVRFAELCAIMTDLPQLTRQGRQMEAEDGTHSSTNQVKIAKLTRALQDWHCITKNQFPPIKAGESVVSHAAPEDTPVILHHHLMYMYYYSFIATLYYSQVTRPASYSRSADGSKITGIGNEELFKGLEEAVYQYTGCLSNLIELEFSQWLPPSVVATTILPSVFLILDSHFAKKGAFTPTDRVDDKQMAPQDLLTILLKALGILNEHYDGANWVPIVVRRILGLADLVRASGLSLEFESWTEFITQSPHAYPHFALMVDVALGGYSDHLSNYGLLHFQQAIWEAVEGSGTRESCDAAATEAKLEKSTPFEPSPTTSLSLSPGTDDFYDIAMDNALEDFRAGETRDPAQHCLEMSGSMTMGLSPPELIHGLEGLSEDDFAVFGLRDI